MLEFDCVVELLSGMCEALVCILGWVGVFFRAWHKCGEGCAVGGREDMPSWGNPLLLPFCSWPLEGDRLELP